MVKEELFASKGKQKTSGPGELCLALEDLQSPTVGTPWNYSFIPASQTPWR